MTHERTCERCGLTYVLHPIIACDSCGGIVVDPRDTELVRLRAECERLRSDLDKARVADTTRLDTYLALEKRMLAATDEADADEIRDKMDPLWLALTEAERKTLDDPARFVTIDCGQVKR